MGFSFHPNERLFFGASMFMTLKSVEYRYQLDISAFPLSDTVEGPDGPIPFYTAEYQVVRGYKFNDYRLLWKFGALYKRSRGSIGLTIKTPSLHIHSDGKQVHHKLSQSNITNSETGGFFNNYIVVDSKYKNDVEVDMKDPFSVALGMTFYSSDSTKAVFTTIEYFGSLKPYTVIEGDESDDITGTPELFPDDLTNNWLSFGSGASAVLNAGIGYKWRIKEDLQLLCGLRTDFNYRKRINDEIEEYKNVQLVNMDVYHISGGVQATVLGQDLIIGMQYSLGMNPEESQLINLSDPVEYNYNEKKPLQGDRNRSFRSIFNSLSIYFGATFNFGGDNKKENQPK
jgi:hypothetical protein